MPDGPTPGSCWVCRTGCGLPSDPASTRDQLLFLGFWGAGDCTKGVALIAVVTLAGAAVTASAAVRTSFMEDFEDGNVDDWSPAGPNGVIEPVAGPVAPNGGDYVGKVNFAGSRYGPNRLLEPSNPDYFSWLFLADADSWHGGGVGFYVSIQSGWMAHISYHQGNLMYRPAHGWAYTPFMPATEGTWYLIELRNIDWSADTYDLWVDGVERVAAAPFLDASEDTGVSRFSAFACGSTGAIYVDDITFGVELPVPESRDDCMKGGWQELTDHDGVPFKNQGDCVSSVTTGGGNPAGG